jgi:PadR family transcriptional regulator PadR
MNDVDPQMLKGLVTLLLLHLVAEREDYGYALVVRLREAGFGDMAEGTVYPALARLEQAKRLDTYLVPSDKGPARKYYRLNAAGALELERSLDAWNHLTGLVGGLVSKEEE